MLSKRPPFKTYDRIEHGFKPEDFFLGELLTGWECPNCGEELYYSDSILLLTCPPKRKVECLECKFERIISV